MSQADAASEAGQSAETRADTLSYGGPSREQPRLRPAARVLVLDPEDRVLLMHLVSDHTDVRSLHVTPGGACDSGEEPARAALRELEEETGLRVADPGPCVWLRRHVWRWGEGWWDQRERYYLLRLNARPEICPTGLEPMEEETVKAWRWWSLNELEAAKDEVFVPRDLAARLRPLLAGEIPVEPVDISDQNFRTSWE